MVRTAHKLKVIILSVAFIFLAFPKISLAACTGVASNTCSGSQTFWCGVNKPPAGNFSRYCCDTQGDCDGLKSAAKADITAKMAGTDNTGGAIPKPKVKCTDERNPEFNSSRPYQASPCGDAPKALMCGNSLVVIETTPTRQAKLGTPYLNVTMPMPEKVYAADVSGVQFPVAGNTELIKNSTTNTDQIDEATRVNEYLSAYLNGTIDQAEYGQTDLSKVVDFAGPLKKLLPSIIQDAQRIVSIKNPSTDVPYEDIENEAPRQGSGDIVSGTGTFKQAPANHNQIVVCAKKDISIPLFITNFLHLPSIGIGREVPIGCYDSGGQAQGDVFRLGNPNNSGGEFNWDGELDGKDISNVVNFIAQNVAKIIPDKTRWTLRRPPLPWSDQNGKPFATSQDYQKAYNEWRGQLCGFWPGSNHLICVGAWPWVNNPYADLFPYVPLSNTTDKNAKNMITGVGVNGENGTEIDKPDYQIIHEPILYFPHTAETSELADLLKKTYVPLKGTASDTLTSSTEPLNDPDTGKCRITNLRSNPGDNLFPEVAPSEVRVHVNAYTVTRIPCHDQTVSDYKNTQAELAGRPAGPPHAVCQGTISIEIRMVTKVPYALEIFNSTTAGADSTFRKIYPKVGVGAPVTCIANIPTVSDVTYTSTENLDKMKVIGPLGDNTTDNAKLYFPHFGSVYDYFLKGIQTALRPKGYGEPTPESGILCQSALETGDCSWNMAKINQGIQNAANKYKVPAGLLKAIFEIENADEINDPSKYQCTTPDQYGSIGVSQVREDLYKLIACPSEQIQDVGVCASNPGKLSRCNFSDAFELMARALLYKAGRLSNCKPTGGIALSEKIVWYDAACNYYGTHNPTDLTNNYANEIPASQKRPGGMSYCDIVCWKMGQCPGYPAGTSIQSSSQQQLNRR